MAYYAFLNDENLVTEVIFGVDETQAIDGKNVEEWYSEFRGSRCVRTSFNATVRKNYAAIGYSYDSERDAFIAPKPFDSWVLIEDTCQWEPPISYPTDGLTYQWDEATVSWVEVPNLEA